ncbi:hypothetical protein Hanom_Chr02g00146141 [Helianthus anomalus]
MADNNAVEDTVIASSDKLDTALEDAVIPSSSADEEAGSVIRNRKRRHRQLLVNATLIEVIYPLPFQDDKLGWRNKGEAISNDICTNRSIAIRKEMANTLSYVRVALKEFVMIHTRTTGTTHNLNSLDS